jgi:4-hydroxy-tetrahydrodipicolinate synthase
MARFQVRGAYTALVTPFVADGNRVDMGAFERHVEAQIAGGLAGLVPCGTTGETPTLEWEEHHAIVKKAIEVAKGRVQILAGAGSNDTRTTIDAVRRVFKDGADAAMIVVPYYNKPSQEGIFQHVRAVAGSVDGPIVLYNVPGRTVTAVHVDTICRICDACENVIGLKDASNNVHDTQALTHRLGDRLDIMSGDDALTVPLMSVGAKGVISVTSNVVPSAVRRVVELMLAGDWLAAQRLHLALLPLHEAMFCAPSPGPVKAALASKGAMLPTVRLPIVELAESDRQRVVTALASFEHQQRGGD